MLFQCIEIHKPWWTTYDKLKQGRWCPTCGGKLPKTLDEYKVVGESNKITFIGKKVPENSFIRTNNWKCKLGHTFRSCYNKVKQNKGCPHCAGNFPKTIEDYRTVGLVRNIGFIDTVIPESVNTPTDGWVDRYGHRWRASFSSINQGSGCPQCHLKTQHKIFDVIKKIYPDFIWESTILQNGRNGKTQKLDMYSPSLHTAIEYDGEQHFKSIAHWGGNDNLAKIKVRDIKKNARCAELGIRLIRINYLDYQKDPEGTIQKLINSL
jgi:hypothetical protein